MGWTKTFPRKHSGDQTRIVPNQNNKMNNKNKNNKKKETNIKIVRPNFFTEKLDKIK